MEKNFNCLDRDPIGEKFLEIVNKNFQSAATLLNNPAQSLNPFFISSRSKNFGWMRTQSRSIAQERLQNPNVGHTDILHHVIEARRGRSDMENVIHEVLSDVNVFLSAGFETTSHSVAFTIYLLSIYPDVQQKLYQELAALKSFSEGALHPTPDELSLVPYMNAVIQESQRMIPVASGAIRHVDKVTKFGEFTFPANTWFSISLVGMFHNPQLYPNPEKFLPERWLKGNITKVFIHLELA